MATDLALLWPEFGAPVGNNLQNADGANSAKQRTTGEKPLASKLWNPCESCYVAPAPSFVSAQTPSSTPSQELLRTHLSRISIPSPRNPFITPHSNSTIYHAKL